MPLARPSVDTVLSMALAQAHRPTSSSPASSADSPALRQAIGQVWRLARQRLCHCDAVDQLDALVARISAAPRP